MLVNYNKKRPSTAVITISKQTSEIKTFTCSTDRYVRIPTEDPTGPGASEPSKVAYSELPIPHSHLSAGVSATGAREKFHLLKLVAQLISVACFLAGRKCGPTLLIAFLVYLYISGFLVSGSA